MWSLCECVPAAVERDSKQFVCNGSLAMRTCSMQNAVSETAQTMMA